MRREDVASLLIMCGVAIQSWGLYDLGGVGLAASIVGTELALAGAVAIYRAVMNAR